jgi:hypothetical protein
MAVVAVCGSSGGSVTHVTLSAQSARLGLAWLLIHRCDGQVEPRRNRDSMVWMTEMVEDMSGEFQYFCR